MAEIELQPKAGRRKTAPPRIDLTPMVDLGFLLITFFMFTTALAKPKTMAVNMPGEGPATDGPAFPLESTVTVIPVTDHRLIWYMGLPDAPQNPVLCGFEGRNSLRDRLIAGKKAAAALPVTFSRKAHQLHVIIKPNDDCTYRDVVAVLDEMNINEVPFYTIVSVSGVEKEWMKSLPGYGK